LSGSVRREVALSSGVNTKLFSTGEGAEVLPRLLDNIKVAGYNADDIKRELFYTERRDSWPMKLSANLIHGLLGLISEVGELCEAYLTGLQTGILDRTNVKEELGDLEWYLAAIRTDLHLTQDEVQEANIEKLRFRFPARFTDKAARERTLLKEREILEGSRPDLQPKEEDTLRRFFELTPAQWEEYKTLRSMEFAKLPKTIQEILRHFNAAFTGVTEQAALLMAISLQSKMGKQL